MAERIELPWGEGGTVIVSVNDGTMLNVDFYDEDGEVTTGWTKNLESVEEESV
jgi:hypothetical protein